jgi:hypothetical protein
MKLFKLFKLFKQFQTVRMIQCRVVRLVRLVRLACFLACFVPSAAFPAWPPLNPCRDLGEAKSSVGSQLFQLFHRCATR